MTTKNLDINFNYQGIKNTSSTLKFNIISFVFKKKNDKLINIKKNHFKKEISKIYLSIKIIKNTNEIIKILFLSSFKEVLYKLSIICVVNSNSRNFIFKVATHENFILAHTEFIKLLFDKSIDITYFYNTNSNSKFFHPNLIKKPTLNFIHTFIKNKFTKLNNTQINFIKNKINKMYNINKNY
jgi:hypothetical protein